MQKTFKNQQGREYCFVQVPSDYQTAKVYENQLNYWTENHTYNDTFPTLIWLPKGNYQILCLAKDATEEQAKLLVDSTYCSTNGCFLFKNYIENDFDFEFEDLATESLTSLLTSLGFKQDDNVLILEKI